MPLGIERLGMRHSAGHPEDDQRIGRGSGPRGFVRGFDRPPLRHIQRPSQRRQCPDSGGLEECATSRIGRCAIHILAPKGTIYLPSRSPAGPERGVAVRGNCWSSSFRRLVGCTRRPAPRDARRLKPEVQQPPPSPSALSRTRGNNLSHGTNWNSGNMQIVHSRSSIPSGVTGFPSAASATLRSASDGARLRAVL